MNEALKAPFPWFGGKSRVAPIVWERFGILQNYVEPFFGSGAVLLGNPSPPSIETINDIDGYVANFWRAVKSDPGKTASYADWPVNENDLHARHSWLVAQKENFVPRLEGDPDFYDAKIAGWWVWGICCWIGSRFCSGRGPWSVVDGQLVHLGAAGQGVNRQLVHLGEWFGALCERLRGVRVCCGDWSRVCGPSPTFKHGLTGVFLDPPYSGNSGRCNNIYASEDLTVARDAREWCLKNGDNKLLRIALCGYEGEHAMPRDWECVEWTTKGGYGSQGNNVARENSDRERIWFSPHCLSRKQGRLF